MGRTIRGVNAIRPGIFGERSFGAFVLDQLCTLDGIEARPMFGGAGVYLDFVFFGILYKERLYFRVSGDTIEDYTDRKAQPFEPFEGRKGESRGYYEVPIEIVESAGELVKWAQAAQRTPSLTIKRKKATPRSPRNRPLR